MENCYLTICQKWCWFCQRALDSVKEIVIMEMKLDANTTNMLKSKLFDNTYRTETLRLPEWDYSEPGSYFVTICTKWRKSFFGTVENWIVILNHFWHIVKQEIYNMESNRIDVDVCIIMPNYVHIIMTINEDYRRDNSRIISPWRGLWDGSWTASTGKNNAIRRSMILPKLIGKFKMQTAKQINLIQWTSWKSFRQTDYYEHVIRDERDFNRIATYISNNPLKRKNDEYYQ